MNLTKSSHWPAAVSRWSYQRIKAGVFFAVSLPAKPLLRNSRFLLHAAGKLRRFGLVHCRKKYVHQQLSVRRGACRQCGTCCNLLYTCPMLTTQGNCLIYGTCRPQAFKTFPIDQRDLDEVRLNNGLCGFRFGRQAIDNLEKSQRD